MHIHDVFSRDATSISLEFFPPKTDRAADELFAHIRQLETLKPSFVSVTYGAGGTTRQRTHDLVVKIKTETSLDPVPHLTCISHSAADIRQILDRYAEAGVSNILALGGDPPRENPNYDRSGDAFKHAADLVKFIVDFNAAGIHPDSRGFGIGVAGFPEGHPSTPNRLLEMDYLKAKVDAGADYICTQLFFDNHDFFDFRERCEVAGITAPILAGIMPITSLSGMKRMAELALGMHYPAKLLKAVDRCGGDAAAVREVGVDWATAQCRDLLANKVRGLHFYTLNNSQATLQVWKNLNV